MGGICDVGSLADCLIGIFRGVADDSILDHYDRVRRDIYYKTINPMSCENFMRVCRQTADHALRHDGFFDMCATARQDGELAEKAQLVSLLCIMIIMYLLADRRAIIRPRLLVGTETAVAA